MARNRKRAKERRTRQPQGATPRSRLAAAPGASAPSDDEPLIGAPNPIEHATPDVELVDAQLAVGRPEPFDEDDPELEAQLEAELEAEAAAEPPLGGGGAGGGRSSGGGSAGGGGEVPAGGAASPAAPEVRAGLIARLIAFLQGSWRELQRVQWPDRRQVVQATSVVLGFVVVAGVFLGVSDYLAQRIVDFILYGHFS